MKAPTKNQLIIKENKMKISEILKNMDNFSDEERVQYIKKLWEKVTPISKQTLINFQNQWDGSKSFEEFKKAQNKLIKECIKMEILINDVKVKENIEVFTMETEIN